MNKKVKIALPIAAGVLALGTGVGFVAARSANQNPYSATLLFDTSTPTTTTTPTPPTKPGRPFCGGGFLGLFGRGQSLQVTAGRIATLLGITTDDLKSQVQSGKTLAEIAASKGVSQDKLVQTILAPVSDELDVLVKYGYLTKDQAATRLQQAQQAVTKLVTSKLNGASSSPDGRAGGMMRRGPGGTGRMMGGGGMMRW